MSPIFYTVVVLSVVALYLISLVAYKTSMKHFFDRFVFAKTTQNVCAYLTLLSVLGFVLAPHISYIQAVWAGLVFTFAFPHVFYWMVRPAPPSLQPPETVADDTRFG